MTRNHRRWHAWIWLILGPLLAIGFAVGLRARPVPVVEAGIPKAALKNSSRETSP
jgi:hypothetical protein